MTMTRRILALVAALALLALPAAAATPTESFPPAGSVLVLIGVSDGLTFQPYASTLVPPTACLPS